MIIIYCIIILISISIVSKFIGVIINNVIKFKSIL
jgi:hypothetical protein